MEFNEVLTSLRTRRAMTKTEVANAVGITRQQIIKFENGTSKPNVRDLLALADYFAVSADFLLGRENYITINKDEMNTYLCLPGKLSDNDFKLLEQFADLLLKRNKNV